MARYQRIEYTIGKDGKVTERVLDGSGTECVASTESLEAALGTVERRELLPEYYAPTEAELQFEAEAQKAR